MGRKKIPGLVWRSGVWHIDKRIGGRRVCWSTGATRLEEAEQVLARLIEENRQAALYGIRPSRTFEQAAAKFVLENQHKRSLDDDVGRLKSLLPWIGQQRLERLHMGTLQPWIEYRRKEGARPGTINHGLKVVRRILNLAAAEWIDERGMTWLQTAPKIKLLQDKNKRKPYPISWSEQDRLFRELPEHLAQMALFVVNTGLRDGEVCKLVWQWEVTVPELNTSVFIIPSDQVKNTDSREIDDRLVVLNRVARSVLDAWRGTRATHVFSYQGKPIAHMLTSGWRRGRVRAGLPQVRVHDLRHTFGRRLRAAGVSFEDRQDLLGHRSGRMTTHYSAPELSRLIEAANRVCERDQGRPELVVLRRLNVS
nr:tyrosine-type recombinase/integrase [Gammaproteobacteria bacterium]